MSPTHLDQFLVALCVFAAGTYLARRQWLALRLRTGAPSCGGGCRCLQGAGKPSR
jgi:hypothetical protein